MRLMIVGIVALIAIGTSACEGHDPAPPSAVSSPVPSAPVPSAAVTAPSPEESPLELAASAEPSEIEGTIDGFVQGGRAWAVYVFAGDPDDASYGDAIELLEELGLERGREFSDGGLCDEGADKVFGEDRPEAVVGAYFVGARHARRFARLFDPPPIGLAHVRTFCAD